MHSLYLIPGSVWSNKARALTDVGSIDGSALKIYEMIAADVLFQDGRRKNQRSGDMARASVSLSQ